MSWLEAVFLGFLQGLTEFLPISSSGHLVLAQEWLGVKTDGLSFEVYLNFASFLAIVAYTRRDLWNVTIHTLRYIKTKDADAKPHFLMFLLLVIGTIPAVVIGVLFEDLIGGTLHSVTSTGVTLIITGAFLFLVRKKQGFKTMESFKKRDAWVIGLAQALALIPGISRSGSTVVAGLLLGLRKELAIRYSFLLSIPIGLGTFVYSAPELAESSLVNEALSAYILVFVVTFFATLLGIKLFVDTLKNNKLIYFALYCWLVGGIALLQPLLFG